MRVLLATGASRKAVAAALSIREVLGAEVAAVFHRVHPNLYSRVFHARILAECRRESIEWAYAVAEAARRLDCDAILPIDYIDAVTLARYRRVVEEAAPLVAPSLEAILAASDKSLLPQLGVPTPPTVVYRRGMLNGRLEDLKPPLVVKGVGDASNPRYHLTVSSALRDAESRGEAVIQEFVPGVARGYYVLSVDGEPILEFTHERIVEYEPIGGPSLAARGPIHDPLLLETGRLVVEKLSWTGVAMVETRYDTQLDEYYVLEVNPKLWGSLDLSVYCGYHFPALLVAGYTRGWGAARKLVERLEARRCIYAWLLDGIRYAAKVPTTLGRLAKLCVMGGCDLDPSDPLRVVAQIATGLARLGREARAWRSRLRGVDREWVRRLTSLLKRGEPTLILDLDGTLVSLPVDWKSVANELEKRGFEVIGESVMQTLLRLYRLDKSLYSRASRIVAKYEVTAVKRARILADTRLLRDISEKFRVCIATRQSRDAVEELVSRLGLTSVTVVSRDDVSPSKPELLKACSNNGIVLDDDFTVVVHAWRSGYTPVHIPRNPYDAAKSMQLGLPALKINEALKLVSALLES